MLKLLLTIVILLSFLVDTKSQTLFLEENFDYEAGQNLTDNGWSAHGDPGTNPITVNDGGLTYADYPSSGVGNAALIDNNGEDVDTSFTSQNSGTIYVSFLINNSTSNDGYFLHLGTSDVSSAYFMGRVFIDVSTSGDFEIGLSYNEGSPVSLTNSGYSFGTTYLIVLKYEFISGDDNDEVSLFVFSSGVPSSEPGTPTLGPISDLEVGGNNDPSQLSTVSLRQHAAGENIIVDGIRISDSWSEAPLPVELSSFTANVNDGTVTLNWKTATEVDNYGFEIERKQQAPPNLPEGEASRIWNKVGFVNGAGNSNSPKSYTFTDNNLDLGKYSYRLKQIDNDGSFEYSKLVEVEVGAMPEGYVLEQNYPNPFNPSTTIKFGFEVNTEASLVIYDVLGNKVAELFNGIADAVRIYNLDFDASNLSSGIYYYKLSSDKFTEVKKMLLMK